MTSPHPAPLDDCDRDILKRLATMITVADPMPANLTDRVLFEISLARLNAELAVMEEETVPLRSTASSFAETVTFTSSALRLMVHFSEDDDALRIDAWVTEGGARVALISQITQHWETPTANGRLTWRNVEHGKVRFLMKTNDPDARLVITPELAV